MKKKNLIISLDAFWSPLLKSPVPSACVCVCVQLACNDGLPCNRHGAGIYQAAERGKFGQIRNGSSCLCTCLFLCLFLQRRVLSLFIPTQFPFSITTLQKELRCGRAWQSWTAARKKHPGPRLQRPVPPRFRLQQEATLASYVITFFWINSLTWGVGGGFPITAST